MSMPHGEVARLIMSLTSRRLDKRTHSRICSVLVHLSWSEEKEKSTPSSRRPRKARQRWKKGVGEGPWQWAT